MEINSLSPKQHAWVLRQVLYEALRIPALTGVAGQPVGWGWGVLRSFPVGGGFQPGLWGRPAGVQIVAPSLASCVTLGKLLNFSVTQRAISEK